MTHPDWAAARALVPLDPTVTMLNSGSFGPTPTPVFDHATALRRRLAAGPTDFFVRQVPPLLWHSRESTAAFLGTTPERFVFTTNVSVAINIVSSSLGGLLGEPGPRGPWVPAARDSHPPALRPGFAPSSPGEILMPDHEYGAMIWAWERAAERLGLTVRTFPLPTMASDPGEIVEAAKKAMTPHTRLFFFSHVLSPTGLVLPAKELCAAARERGILTVVDGAHAPAMIPLNVSDVAADFYTGNLHKWLLAPIGCGFLVIGSGMEDRLQPLVVSWGYKTNQYPISDATPTGPDDRDVYGSTPRTRYLEFDGTRDVCPWLSVPAAIDFQTALGFDAIRARMAELAEYTRGVMPLKLATPAMPGLYGAMTAFELPPGKPAVQWRKELWDRRIEAPIIERPERLLVRVSHHFYTTEAEIDVLAGFLRDCR